MAIRGRKPTPTVIKLARGNPGKRPLPANEPIVTGAPIKPPKLGKRANELWNEVTSFAAWITIADGYKLHVWCELQAEFERSPSKMNASRIARLTITGSELGLDPGSRARLGMALGMAGIRSPDAKQNKETVESEFFDRHKRSD